MDLDLSPREKELAAKGRAFCEQVLMPLEILTDEHGELPMERRAAVRQAVRDWGLAGINHTKEYGGLGLTMVEQTVIEEQLVRVTTRLWSCVWRPQVTLKICPAAQQNLRSPKFMHNFAFDHAELRFEETELSDDKMLGAVGQGLELTKDWFVEARLQISAHALGAATRAAEIANDYATNRHQFNRPIRDFQGVEFMLADMAVELFAAKSMLYRVAWEIDRGADRKTIHAHASALKLHCSEMAGRVIDKALQVLGGRGYMRENPVERLYRDIRVDRIWEGTSEIQRVVVAGQIRKRGLDVYTGW